MNPKDPPFTPESLPTPEEWELVSELFVRCSAVEHAEQGPILTPYEKSQPLVAAYVRAMCAAANHLESEPSLDPDHSPTIPPPISIDSYVLGPQLGVGGMGAVYEAVRVNGDFREDVAIKIIRRGFESDAACELFRRERLILSKLRHDCIALLKDGGSFGNRIPYLVMERIYGVPIDEYTKHNRLSVRQKLGLFMRLCAAVQYAHLNQVVHQDIKPGNILVDQHGNPKLLDFGVAKLLTFGEEFDSTAHAATGFTPEYASPEQKNGSIVTTASDIYSLCVVFRELLAETPFSQDLHFILAKGTAESPEKRYASAAELAADLERYLESRPVEARPRRPFYVFQKFIDRNRISSLLVASLAASLLLASVWAVRQTYVASEGFNELHKIFDSLLIEIPKNIREVPHSTFPRAILLRKSLEILNREFRSRPEFREDLAVAYENFADVEGNPSLENLGEIELSMESLSNAIQIRSALRTAPSTTLANQLSLAADYERVGYLEFTRGNFPEADRLFHRAELDFEKARRLDFANRRARTGLGEIQNDYGRLSEMRGETAEAARHFAAELKLFEDLARPDNALSMQYLSQAYKQNAVTSAKLGNFRVAHALLNSAKSIDDQYLKVDSGSLMVKVDFAQWLSDSGSIYELEGKLNEAADEFERALNLRGDLSTDYPDDVKNSRFLATGFVSLGRVLAKREQFTGALPLLSKGAKLFDKLTERYPANNTFRTNAAAAFATLGSAELTRAQRDPNPLSRRARAKNAGTAFERALSLWQEVKRLCPQHALAASGILEASGGIATSTGLSTLR